jgi:preprotein translocase subunit SecA
MKILKEVNINGILEDFFNEILQLLNNSRMNYQKSHDEKSYLTELKNITGNSVSDSQLLEYGKLEESKFNEKIKELYLNKKKSRVEILGEDQNNSLEKKIFLQIIDFSWRSHLQYLEQLRQVIGLRQYGQKDPLSEFKKEAFVLFEGLLTKIKNDLIKFLLNLNIVISDKEEKEEEKEKYVEKKLNKKGKIKRW